MLRSCEQKILFIFILFMQRHKMSFLIAVHLEETARDAESGRV